MRRWLRILSERRHPVRDPCGRLLSRLAAVAGPVAAIGGTGDQAGVSSQAGRSKRSPGTRRRAADGGGGGEWLRGVCLCVPRPRRRSASCLVRAIALHANLRGYERGTHLACLVFMPEREHPKHFQLGHAPARVRKLPFGRRLLVATVGAATVQFVSGCNAGSYVANLMAAPPIPGNHAGQGGVGGVGGVGAPPFGGSGNYVANLMAPPFMPRVGPNSGGGGAGVGAAGRSGSAGVTGASGSGGLGGSGGAAKSDTDAGVEDDAGRA
jgi:hypothetical protein